MECPGCRRPLVVVERDAIELDWCPRCRGFWFDAGEIDLLASKQGLAPAEGDLARFAPAETKDARRACPRCDRRMDRVWFDAAASVMVDRCTHGLWFDRGEMGDALATLRPREGGRSAALATFLGETFGR